MTVLCSPAFLISILVLGVNDFYLKTAFPGLVTGKLSDFSGLFALPIFLAATLSLRPKLSGLLTAVFFVFWKSPASQLLIDNINELGLPFQISRLVDPTDLVALVMIPLSGWYMQAWDRTPHTGDYVAQHWRARIALPCAAVVLSATSIAPPPPVQRFYAKYFRTYKPAEGSKKFRVIASPKALASAFEDRGMTVYSYSTSQWSSCPTKLMMTRSHSCCTQPIEDNRSKINSENEASFVIPSPPASCNPVHRLEFDLRYRADALEAELVEIGSCDAQSPSGETRLSDQIFQEFINPIVRQFRDQPGVILPECAVSPLPG